MAACICLARSIFACSSNSICSCFRLASNLALQFKFIECILYINLESLEVYRIRWMLLTYQLPAIAGTLDLARLWSFLERRAVLLLYFRLPVVPWTYQLLVLTKRGVHLIRHCLQRIKMSWWNTKCGEFFSFWCKILIRIQMTPYFKKIIMFPDTSSIRKMENCFC